MPEPAPKKLFPNPFYVLLLVASTLFVLTTFGYLISPTVRQQNAGARGGGSLALADWFDRRGPIALGAEVVTMIVSGILAMATDRWFSPRPAGNRTSPRV